MPRSRLDNEGILRKLAFSEEYHHRRCRQYFFGLGFLTLPPSLPIPQVHLGHIQDSCNKSYSYLLITHHLAGHTKTHNCDSANRSDKIFSIYERWFRDHNVDIDFANFVAKLIRVKISSFEQRPTAGDIIELHKAWCEHVESSLPLCPRKPDST